MEYNSIYNSPLGRILITEQNGKLTGLKFLKKPLNTETNITPVIKKTIEWLDAYFNGENQDTLSNLTPEYSLEGSEFQKKVWKEISLIPRGKTKTYGEISLSLVKSGIKSSPRAVGMAAGKNKILLIIPCHRVVAKSGPGGFNAGINIKQSLLDMEKKPANNLKM